jgi:hypothetical protein
LTLWLAPAAAKVPEVLAFGDSLTAGLGLPADEAFPARLAARLKADGIDVKMINGGVSGDTTSDGLARLDWALADKPDVVILALGEVSVAKNVYVALRTGWFSCRSACYLAAGRPVVVQDTGFSKLLPTGRGLHAFTGEDQAAAAIEAVEADYARETAAARDVAIAQFDAQQILAQLIENAFSVSSAPLRSAVGPIGA